MAPQQDRLSRIANESLALLDDLCGPPGRYQPQVSLVYHGPQISTVRVLVPASNEVTQFFSGMKMSRPEPEPVLSSDQAALKYGGFVVVDHGRKQNARWP